MIGQKREGEEDDVDVQRGRRRERGGKEEKESVRERAWEVIEKMRTYTALWEAAELGQGGGSHSPEDDGRLHVG